MTDESEGSTEPWIKEHGAKYPYAYMTKAARASLSAELGWGGFPASSLIGPDGTVVWSGHPSSLTAAILKKHLVNADTTPVGISAVIEEWPEEAKKVARKLKSEDYGGALKEAEKLESQSKELVLANVQGLINRLARQVKGPWDAGDYLGFELAWKRCGKLFRGLEQEDEFKALAKKAKKDKEIKQVVKAQKKLYMISQSMQGSRTQEETTRFIAAIQSIVEDLPDTFAARRGQQMIKQLQGGR